MLWIEDEKSFMEKLDLVREKDLAGEAFWRLGFEKDSIWAVIQDYE